MKAGRIFAGQKFTRWTVVSKSKSIRYVNGTSVPIWLCKCDCGSTKEVRAVHLRSGKSGSCGCLQKEIAAETSFKHGEHNAPMYVVWVALLQRCENPKNKSYKNYGARGITVCPEWHDYAIFHRDMAPAYQNGLTIDRKNNDQGYSPENCRWVSNKVNCRNRPKVLMVDWQGISLPLNDLAERYGIKQHTLYSRYRLKGWPLEKSLNHPIAH